MTDSDKRNLFGGAILMIASVIGTLVAIQPNLQVIAKVLIPQNFEVTLISMVVASVLSAIIMVVFYSGGTDDHHTTNYYYVQPSMEEIIFRFNSMIVLHTQQLTMANIVILCLIQAFIFAVLHGAGIVKHFILAIIWFIAAYYGGILPAMVGHTVANLTYRTRARAHHGWYDNDDD